MLSLGSLHPAPHSVHYVCRSRHAAVHLPARLSSTCSTSASSSSSTTTTTTTTCSTSCHYQSLSRRSGSSSSCSTSASASSYRGSSRTSSSSTACSSSCSSAGTGAAYLPGSCALHGRDGPAGNGSCQPAVPAGRRQWRQQLWSAHRRRLHGRRLGCCKAASGSSGGGSGSAGGSSSSTGSSTSNSSSSSSTTPHAATQSVQASPAPPASPSHEAHSPDGHSPEAAAATPSTPPYSSYAQHYKQTHLQQPLAAADGNGGGSGSGRHGHADVKGALQEAQQALQSAEQWVQKVGADSGDVDQRRLQLSLPSDQQPPTWWMRAFRVARSLTVLSVLCVAMVASHAFGLYIQLAGAAAGALALAAYGYRTASLSMTGACAAVLVGAATLGCSLRMGMTLILFFLSSSKLTQFKEELKEGLDEQSKKGGQRDWLQVACNAGVPTLLAVLYGVLAGCVDLPLGPSPSLEPWRAQLVTLLLGSFLGYYACCCGDTWASELGTLSKETPRLITNWRPVRRGTNGAVTLLGLAASVAGGLFIGLVSYLAALIAPTLWIFPLQHSVALGQWQLIPLGLFAGLFGSLLDSLLGATLQYTGFNRRSGRITSTPGPDVVHLSGTPLLTNNMVNLLSATLTAGLTGLLALLAFA